MKAHLMNCEKATWIGVRQRLCIESRYACQPCCSKRCDLVVDTLLSGEIAVAAMQSPQQYLSASDREHQKTPAVDRIDSEVPFPAFINARNLKTIDQTIIQA